MASTRLHRAIAHRRGRLISCLPGRSGGMHPALYRADSPLKSWVFRGGGSSLASAIFQFIHTVDVNFSEVFCFTLSTGL